MVSVSRKDRVLFEYYDLHGKKHRKEFDGLQARVIQHEMDHLEGVSMFDKSIDTKFNRDWLAYARLERLLSSVPKKALEQYGRRIPHKMLLEGLFAGKY